MIVHWVSVVFLPLDSLLLLGCAWVMICNYRTHKELITVLESLRLRPLSAVAILTALKSASYQQHLRARLLLRDPWALYDPIVGDAYRNPHLEIIGELILEAPEPPPAMH